MSKLFKKNTSNTADNTTKKPMFAKKIKEQGDKPAKKPLFGKKSTTQLTDTADEPSPASAKKPLFGKKSRAKDNGVVDNKPTKKPAFSFGKKADKSTNATTKTAASANKQAVNELIADNKKSKTLLMVLFGLLAVVVLALLAKMFLFAEPIESPNDYTTATDNEYTAADQNPEVTLEATSEAATEATAEGATDTAATVNETAQEAPTSTEQASTTQNTAAQNTAAEATAQPAAEATAQPAKPAVQKPITHDDFIKESQQRLYIERDTTPPAKK